jgi:hypothetical protein
VLTRALLTHCKMHLSRDSFRAFFKAISVVFHAHIEESRFIQGMVPGGLPTYMQFRTQTISLNPFFEVIKCEYLDAEWESSPIWDDLQMHVSRAAGLQNDLIGLERDMKEGEPLNAVIVLLRTAGSHDNNLVDDALLADSVNSIAENHNQSVALALDGVGDICLAASAAPRETFSAVASVTRHIVSLADTHLRWCSTAKRYNANISQKSISTTALASVSSEPDSHTVRSVGIYHGLPTYPESNTDTSLTALVTGATGLSGYHMVRALASSRRWKTIVCLGSRPPPANFFADLGDGADRVEHLAVDFRTDPSEIARCLSERISKVYVQVEPSYDSF